MTDDTTGKGAWWLLLPVAWMAGLYALSTLRPGSLPISNPFPYFDKVAHAGVYFVLILTFVPWGMSKNHPRAWLPFAVGSALGFAMADEVHQFLVPGREPEWGDLVADAVGICVASALCLLGWSRRQRCRII